ncbi:hypothetical protein [Halalkalibaculum sp. DA384]|uniref:hypothetical protein n=1 Tax=Halalkalibaculum sp. DA384 TaxID=3373606 RepID=UPI003755238B
MCGGSGCRVDTRLEVDNEQSIQSCGEQCPLLDYNEGSNLYGYGNGADSKYRRTLVATNPQPGEVILTATVEWTRSGGNQSSVEISESVFDYRRN